MENNFRCSVYPVLLFSLLGLHQVSSASEVDPPKGQKLDQSLYARGFQIYECQKSDAGTYAWAFKAPEARLYRLNGELAGYHYAGPTWESTVDGSKIQGARLASEASTRSASIPHLLLSAKVLNKGESFGNTSYIVRIDTSGGSAPDSGCDANTSSAQVKVPYTARYDLYRPI